MPVLLASQILPLPRPRVFPFFAEAANLERITPPELRFSIAGRPPDSIEAGTLIDYRLSLHGVPFGWRTRIAAWVPDELFVDEQLRGPYALWRHRHEFRDTPDGGTAIEDRVEWELPLAPLSRPIRPLVRAQLARIFAHRHHAVREALGLPPVADPGSVSFA